MRIREKMKLEKIRQIVAIFLSHFVRVFFYLCRTKATKGKIGPTGIPIQVVPIQ